MTNEEELIREIDKNSKVRLYTPPIKVGVLFAAMYLVLSGIIKFYMKGEVLNDSFPTALIAALLLYVAMLSQVSKLDTLKSTIKEESDFMNSIPVYTLEGEKIVGDNEEEQRELINSALNIKINYQLFFYKWIAPIPIMVAASIIMFQEVKSWI